MPDFDYDDDDIVEYFDRLKDDSDYRLRTEQIYTPYVPIETVKAEQGVLAELQAHIRSAIEQAHIYSAAKEAQIDPITFQEVRYANVTPPVDESNQAGVQCKTIADEMFPR